MSNTITIELCPEDRARLDKIIEGLATLSHRPDCSACVKDVADVMERACQVIDRNAKPEPLDDVQQMARDVLARQAKQEAPKNAQEAPKASDHPTLDPFPEVPEAKAEASEATEKPVSTAELQHTVIALCRAGKKDAVREVISTYGVQSVAAVPQDKLAELYAKLKKLEG